MHGGGSMACGDHMGYGDPMRCGDPTGCGDHMSTGDPKWWGDPTGCGNRMGCDVSMPERRPYRLWRHEVRRQLKNRRSPCGR